MAKQDVTDFKRVYRTSVSNQLQDKLELLIVREADLRYGENPNQSAAIYVVDGFRFPGYDPETGEIKRDPVTDKIECLTLHSDLAKQTNIRLAKTGKEGLSATNMMDISRALDILKYFDMPAVAVMKHLNPCGFARQYEGNTLYSITIAAVEADLRSAFGGIVVTNRPLDEETAAWLVPDTPTTGRFFECVVAPSFEEGAMKVLERKKDLRVARFDNIGSLPKFTGDDTGHMVDVKWLPTGRLIVQELYLSSIKSGNDLIVQPMVRKNGAEYHVEREPTAQELQDLLTAWYVNIGVRSNGIVIVKDGVTLAVGTGQQERVGAVEQAIVKAYQKAMDREGIKYDPLEGAAGRERLGSNPLEGAVASSDAFFPFRDSIDTLARVGVTAVVQPGGSLRDHESIQAANEHRMAMPFTLERCFGHF